MKKVIALTRVSTLSQELESQEQKVIEACLSDGYKHEEIIIISNKESGVLLSEEEMLGLDTLKEEIDNPLNQIEAVYVFELSRIDRQGKILYSIRDFLISHKVQLVCLNPSFRILKPDLSFDESSNVIFGIYVSMAESEGYIRKARLKRGKDKAKAEGRYTGGKILFGYKLNEEKKFIIDDINSSIVKRIFEMYISGLYSARKISSLLYNEGIITQANEKTREMFVTKTLKNKSYCGTVLYPAIITNSQYEKSLQLLSLYQVKPRRTYQENIYLGHKLLYVEDNQRQMMIRKSDAAYVEPISGFCVNINMIDSLLLYCADKSIEFHRQSDIEEMQEKFTNELSHLDNRLLNYKAREKELKAQIDRVEERLIIGKLSPEKAAAIENRIEKELKELAVSLQNDLTLRLSLEKNLNAIRGEYDMNMNVYSMSPQEQQDFIRNEIDKVWISRVKNAHYTVRISFSNKLIDGEIYEVFTKQRKFTLYGKPVNVKIIDRIKSFRKP